MVSLAVCVLLLTCLTLLTAPALGSVAAGKYRGSSSWVFVGRFAFSAGQGRTFVELLFPEALDPTLLLYFLDSNSSSQNEFAQWQDTHSGALSCQEKMARADVALDVRRAPGFKVAETSVDGTPMLRVNATFLFSTRRSRWMFASLAGCSPEPCETEFCVSGVDAAWSLTFTNDGNLSPHLGSDEVAQVYVSSVLLALYAGLLVLVVVPTCRALERAGKLHLTVQLLLAAIVAMWLSTTLTLAYLASFGSVGLPYSGLLHASFGLAAASEWCSLLMVLLVGKGWTITTRKVSGNGRMRIAVYVTAYCFAQVTCVIYYFAGVPREDVAYIYDTTPGHVLVVLRLVALAWVNHAVNVNVHKYRQKRRFYAKFRVLVSAWLLALPALVLLNSLLPEYNRATVLYSLSTLCTFALHAVLALLYNPEGFFRNSFPFHASASSVSIGSDWRRLDDDKAAVRRTASVNRTVQKVVSAMQTQNHDLEDFLSQLDPHTLDLDVNDEDLPPPARIRVRSQKVQNWVGIGVGADAYS